MNPQTDPLTDPLSSNPYNPYPLDSCSVTFSPFNGALGYVGFVRGSCSAFVYFVSVKVTPFEGGKFGGNFW
jgi:hypothetical protein